MSLRVSLWVSLLVIRWVFLWVSFFVGESVDESRVCGCSIDECVDKSMVYGEASESVCDL